MGGWEWNRDVDWGMVFFTRKPPSTFGAGNEFMGEGPFILTRTDSRDHKLNST